MLFKFAFLSQPLWEGPECLSLWPVPPRPHAKVLSHPQNYTQQIHKLPLKNMWYLFHSVIVPDMYCVRWQFLQYAKRRSHSKKALAVLTYIKRGEEKLQSQIVIFAVFSSFFYCIIAHNLAVLSCPAMPWRCLARVNKGLPSKLFIQLNELP